MGRPLETAPGPAVYDPDLNGWVLSRYSDVRLALMHPDLLPPGSGSGPASRATNSAAGPALAPDAWCGELERIAAEQVAQLPCGEAVDLMQRLAVPVGRALAARLVPATPDQADTLLTLARTVFHAAASSTTGMSDAAALAATAELARRLGASPSSLEVQAFVALTHTLPGFLAGAWWELARHTGQGHLIRNGSVPIARAVEELLRIAGPSRAVFRQAVRDVELADHMIPAGHRVILRLSAANRDPARFPDPDRLDLQRDAGGHLAFGAGRHACPGARLIRMAAASVTRMLLDRVDRLEPGGEATWTGGYAIVVPARVPVVLHPGDG